MCVSLDKPQEVRGWRQLTFRPLADILADAQAEAANGRAAEAFTVYRSAVSLCAPPNGSARPLELLPMAHSAAKLCLDNMLGGYYQLKRWRQEPSVQHGLPVDGSQAAAL